MNALLRRAIDPRGAVVVLLAVILVAIVVLNPSFAEPGQLVRFIQRVAPIAIVAIGQYFVIVSGEFDLSMGALVTAQVVTAGNLIGTDEAKAVPVLVLMLVLGVVVGVVNGLATTLLKVPSFIVSLGTMLVIHGGVMWWTGGAATGNPADSFRQIGRGGIEGVPVLGLLPYAVLVLLAVILLAVWLSRRPFGRTLVAIGDNAEAAAYAGASVWRTKTLAFVLSSLSATVAGVLLVGYAGVHPSVGQGYEFIAITAVVLGGVVLGGGRGTVLGALTGAFTLESLFTLLNFTAVPATMRDAIQGAIIIAAVAYSGAVFAKRRRTTRPPAPASAEAERTTTSASEPSPIHLTGDSVARE
ncbi:monosaccharide ABC transporter membrane protein (CUT2 family) [Brevibacterium sanguinis]|uniref:Monosaccharide ABC transporter membrane protein (CUT2 family) n=2 Tax=Brevibacterium TaxID=1696 RepID=A0A366IIC5_9MICO|nr:MULTISPECIES: ABC transporter permease [Brevibacterium]RBP65114.1 monosaccharide ABC transporter membrane protein (CUT2 family) [Brevibacterium sanguinis]RBP71377.1 monosaccharide ABC transporter membrane protein (CUT2 family) [Brevibacterium celere]